MPINIRQKGADAERALATELNTAINVVKMELGLPITADPIVQRNQNQTAVGGCDLVGTFGYEIEVKRQEQLAINTWWAQCVKSAERSGGMPVLIYRQSRQPWRVVMNVMVPVKDANKWRMVRAQFDFEDFLEIFKDTVRAKFQAVIEYNKNAPVGEQLLFA